MRLGQMARKLAIAPSEIVQYLASQQSVIEENSNIRLTDTQVDLLLRKFAPDLVNVYKADPLPEPGPEEAVEISTPVIVPLVDEVPSEASVTEPVENNQDVNEVNHEEVIKAPKVTLTGLKVLGKIDLPEPKKKESPTPDSPVEAGTEIPKQEERKPYERRKPSREQRPYKNPISLQRERELKAELEKRKEKAAQEKERKTQNYLKKVKMSPPTKAMRLIDEPTEQLTAEELKEEPKTWFGKLIKWLST